MAEITVVRNEDQHRYEAVIDGKVAGFAKFRSKLGQGFEKPFIVAVHKVGYKFVEP